MKRRVANKGEKIIDLNGYIYTAEEIYPKYVSIGNGEFIVHSEYRILPAGMEKDMEDLAQISEKISSKYGNEIFESAFQKILTRMHYIHEGKMNPKHVWTFEEYEEQEGDSLYELELSEGNQTYN